MITAVIFVPEENSVQFALQCNTYCSVKGYVVDSVVTGNWSAVLAMVLDGTADVVVVARPEHVDPVRLLRLEVAILDQPAPHTTVPPGHRRAHRV